jgi:hypothetical protein
VALSRVARRNLENLGRDEVVRAADAFVERNRFQCVHCYDQVISVFCHGDRTVLSATPHRRGTHVLVPRRAGFVAVDLVEFIDEPEVFGAIGGLGARLFVLHARACGRPVTPAWVRDRDPFALHFDPVAEVAVKIPPSQLRVGDRVVVAIAPEEGVMPISTPCTVQQIDSDGTVHYGYTRRRWDDRARLTVRRPLSGPALDLVVWMCAAQLLRDAGCDCEVPVPELRLGTRPRCLACFTDAGYRKGIHRRYGWADDPTPIQRRHLRVVTGGP